MVVTFSTGCIFYQKFSTGCIFQWTVVSISIATAVANMSCWELLQFITYQLPQWIFCVKSNHSIWSPLLPKLLLDKKQSHLIQPKVSDVEFTFIQIGVKHCLRINCYSSGFSYVIFVILLTPAPFSANTKIHTYSRFLPTKKRHKIQDFYTKTHQFIIF